MTNWLGQNSFLGTWDNPPGYSSSVSMQMENYSLVQIAGQSSDISVFVLGTEDAWNYQYLIHNLTVTAFNSNGSNAYVGLRLRMFYSVNTTGQLFSNQIVNITGNRTIGPNQTAQIISKDAPLAMGYCYGNSYPDYTSDGRIWKLDARTQRDNTEASYAEMHFHISYLKISRASE